MRTGTISPVLSSHCQNYFWIIDTGGPIALTFTSFDLEDTYDAVKVCQGSTVASANLLASATGSASQQSRVPRVGTLLDVGGIWTT